MQQQQQQQQQQQLQLRYTILRCAIGNRNGSLLGAARARHEKTVARNVRNVLEARAVQRPAEATRVDARSACKKFRRQMHVLYFLYFTKFTFFLNDFFLYHSYYGPFKFFF